MKKKSTSVIAILSCIILLISVFTACKNKDDIQNPSELSPEESWYPGVDSTYVPVTIGSVELADIVKEALGDEAKNFNGDLSSLSPEQLKKVEDVAKEKGYKIDKNDQGKPVVKDPKYAEASYEEKKKIIQNAGVSDINKLSDNDKKKLEEEAKKEGMTLVANNDGSFNIVKPTTTRNYNYPTVPTRKPNPNTPVGNNETKYTYTPIKPATTLIKTNLADKKWVEKYTDKISDTFMSSVAASDGIVCAGTSFTSSSSTASTTNVGLLAKFDFDGKQMWAIKEGKGGTTNFEAATVLTDGSIIAVGTTTSTSIVPDEEFKCKDTVEGVIAKYKPNGKKIFLKIFGGSKSDMIYSVAATPDGGYVIGGKTTSVDGDLKGISPIVENPISAFVVKYDSDDNFQWLKSYSGTKHSSVNGLAVTPDGKIYASTSVYAATGDYALIGGMKEIGKSVLITCYSPDGSTLWTKTFKNSGGVELKSITVAKDGGCVLAGYYNTDKTGKNSGDFQNFYNGGMAGTTDALVIKLKPSGSTDWIVPLIGYEGDFATGVVSVPGGYAVTGFTTSSNRDFISNSGNYDSFLYVLSEYGEKQTIASFGGSESDTARAICSDGSKNVYLCGITNSSDGDYFNDFGASENCAVAFVAKFDLIQGNEPLPTNNN